MSTSKTFDLHLRFTVSIDTSEATITAVDVEPKSDEPETPADPKAPKGPKRRAASPPTLVPPPPAATVAPEGNGADPVEQPNADGSP